MTQTVKHFFQGSEQSYFLFGPRGTGKSTWLAYHYRNCLPLEKFLKNLLPGKEFPL